MNPGRKLAEAIMVLGGKAAGDRVEAARVLRSHGLRPADYESKRETVRGPAQPSGAGDVEHVLGLRWRMRP